ncbi:MAG TPA: putative Ig domain-containing protein, partial [Myxococcaceae bacterium]
MVNRTFPGRLALWAALALGALGASGCFDFDKAFEDCKTSGFCTGDGGTGGPVTITTTALPDAYAGRTYTQTLAATGGTGVYAWSVSAGALPAGLALSMDGVLSGTATDPGPASFTVTVSSAGNTADQPLTLEVLPALALSTTALPDGYTGQAYSKAIAATGGKPPYVFAVQGTVPDGLSLSSSGVLSGTPTFAFSGIVTIAVRDANTQVTATPLPITIYAPPAITTGQLPDGYTDQPYSVTLAVVDGKAPYTFSISAGTLPPGLSLDAMSGQISGNPGVPQNVSLIVTATDANGKTASRPLTLGIYAPVSITSATTLPDAYTQTGYDVTLTRSGGKGTVIWIAGSGLPAGISLSIDGHLTGSPSTSNPSPSTFSVTATDGNLRSDTRVFTLGTYDQPNIATTALADGTLNVVYSDQLAGTGGKPPLTWMLGSGSLPNGLTLSSSGLVSGTPSTAGGSNFVVTVTDANGRSRSSTVTCTVYSALTISTGALPVGYAGGVAYGANLAAAGGRSPYTWALVSGSLPPPLVLNAQGAISGTPAGSGTANFTVQVTDANSATTTKALSLGVVPAPSIITASLDDGYIGVAYGITVQAQDGKPPYTFSLTGALPNGLSLDPVTGQISGTPSSAASATITVQLTDGNGLTASRPYAFGTYATPSVITTSLPDGYVGDAFSQALASSGGKAPYTWSLAAGSFAAGLTLNGNGTVTGTPSAVQSTSVTVRLSDANGRAASGIVTQQIYAPPSIITSLGDGYAGAAYPSTTLVVNGGKPPYSFNITSGSLPSGMSFAGATGTFSGTPAAAGTASFTVTVTDANARSANLPMSLPVYDLPSVTTASLADAYAGASYSGTLAGSGGKAPIAWSVSSGTLPAGLSLSGGGIFSGSSGTAGSSTFTVQMTDANGRQATRSLSLAVLSALSVTTAAVSDGYAGSPYSTAALAATGGRSPYTFSAVGALPSGLSLSGAGTFSGTPAASGTTTFDAKVTDANNATAQRTLTLDVYGAPSIAGTLVDAYQGTSYSGALTGSGGKAPYGFAVTSGALPAGLSLSGGGTLTGTPTTAGSSGFTVTLTDANGVTATRNLNVSTLAPVAVATSSLADGYQGRSYSMTLAGSGGRTPYTFAVTSGALPGGLSLSGGSGLISGTPGAVGSSSLTVTVTDANGVSAAQSFTLPVLAVPSITTSALPDGYVSTAYSAPSLAGTNGRAPYTFSVASGLPPGVSVSSAGAFSGTPSGSATSYPFTATLTDANGVTATANLTIAVWSALLVGGGGLPDGYLTDAYSGTVSASGGKAPYTWSVASGALPSGVTLNPSSGGLSGTPGAAGTASFTAQVADANGVTATGAKSIQTFALPSITTSSLANASVGAPYSASLAVAGGKPTYTWTVTAGALPAGITLAADGTLSGTTNVTPGSFIFTATVTDANGKTAGTTLSLQVVTGLNITTSAINDGYVGSFFSQTLTQSGAMGTLTWSVIGGTLTPGLSLAAGTGILSGTPAAAGTYNFTIQASDTIAGTTSKAFTQTVYTLPSVATASLPDAYTDQAYSQSLSGSGGKTPYSWAITVGAPPSGITFNGGSTGTLTGQPAAAGSASFTVQVTDANGRTATRPLSIAAYAPPAQTSPAALADGYTGRSYSTTIGTSGGKAPLTFAVTAGALPAGLALGSGTGMITGTPSALGTSSFTVTVTDANSRTAPMAHTITVYAPPAVTTSSLPQGYYQVAYGSAALAATGGVAPLTWSVTTGTLPSGLVMGLAGIINGSPTN